jgi:superfamily I DNA and/or RNA helicase
MGEESIEGKLGIITPYKAQVELLKSLLKDYEDDINTVDSFQGQERDIIIFNSVRSGKNIGFLNDLRRLNVAITRAKHYLFIVGNINSINRQ